MNNLINHIFTVTLRVYKISLKVRFPCSVACAVKIDSRQKQFGNDAQLKNGEAKMEGNWQQEIVMGFDRYSMNYVNKKIILLIYLKSTSGKISAGSVSIVLGKSKNHTARQVCKIQKCPDKNAMIEFELAYRLIDEGERMESETTIQRFPHLRSESPNRNLSQIMKRITPDKYKIEERKFAQKGLKTSQARYEPQEYGKQESDHQILRRIRSKMDISDKGSLFNDYYVNEKRGNEDIEKIFNLQRQVENQKTKLIICQNELAGKRSKITQLQKQIKQQSKKYEQQDIQKKQMASKIDVLQKNNKEINAQVKVLAQKLEEEKLLSENYIKRFEMRQTTNKEQIRMITQKLHQSENQKQKMILDKNYSANESEDRQKKLRESFKEKEKKLIEEKNSVLKKLDAIQKQLEQMAQSYNDAKNKNAQLVQMTHELKAIVEGVEEQKQRYKAELSSIRYELNKCKNQKKLLEENMDVVNKYSDQRRSFRRQLGEKDAELTQLKERIQGLQASGSKTKMMMDDLEKSVKQKSIALRSLEKQHNILLKEYKANAKALDERESKILLLNEEIQNEIKKARAVEVHIKNQGEKYQDQKQQLLLAGKQKNQRIDHLETEIDKLNQEIFCQMQQLASFEKEAEEFQEMIDEKDETIKSLESQLIQLNQASQLYQMQKIQISETKDELELKLTNKINDQEETISELKGKIQKVRRECEQRLSEGENENTFLRDNVKELNDSLKSKQNEIRKMNDQVEKISLEMHRREEEVENHKKQNKNVTNELANQRQVVKKLKKQISENQSKNESANQSLLSLQNQNQQLKTKCDGLSSEVKKTNNTLKLLKQNFENYKESTQQILDEITTGVGSIKVVGLSQHSDQEMHTKLSSLNKKINKQLQDMVRTIKERDEDLAKYRQENQLLLEEKERKEQQLSYTGEHLQHLKKSTSIHSEQLISTKARIKQLEDLLQQKQNQYQEQLGEASKKITNLTNTINAKNKQIHDERLSFEDQTNKFQERIAKIQQQNSKNEREKKKQLSDIQLQLTQAEINLRSEIDRSNSLQSECSNLDKEQKLEKENMRKLMRELQNKCYDYEELEQKYQEVKLQMGSNETEFKRLKTIYFELKSTFEGILSSNDISFINQIHHKIEPIVSLLQSREHQYLRSRIRLFYERYISLIEQKQEINERVTELTSDNQRAQMQLQNIKKEKQKTLKESLKKSMEFKVQKESEMMKLSEQKSELITQIRIMQKQMSERASNAEREKYILKKQIQVFEKKLEDAINLRSSDPNAMVEVYKMQEEQKSHTQKIKKYSEDIIKLINSLEKDKKVSIFVLSPLKEVVKKVEEGLSNGIKLGMNILTKMKLCLEGIQKRAKFKGKQKRQDEEMDLLDPHKLKTEFFSANL